MLSTLAAPVPGALGRAARALPAGVPADPVSLLLVLRIWEWHPSVLAGCALLALAYGRWARPRSPERVAAFGAGLLVLLLALVSPLDPLGDDVLFSAHMVQHVLLALVVPPLLLLGMPAETVRRLLRRRPLARAERLLGRPGVAWPLFVGTLWLWHLPVLYDATLRDLPLHICEHLTLLATGVAFWWPVACPLAEARMDDAGGVLYLFFGGLANTLLGVTLTFVPRVLYTPYVRPPDPHHLLPYLRSVWGLTPAADQTLGGALMWVVGMAVFAVGISVHVGAMLRRSAAGPQPLRPLQA